MADKYNQSWVMALAKNGEKQWAVTIGQTTYYSCPEMFVTDKWRAHEDKHKEQYRRIGFFGFLVEYAKQISKYGYENAPLEIEARQAATDYKGDNK